MSSETTSSLIPDIIVASVWRDSRGPLVVFGDTARWHVKEAGNCDAARLLTEQGMFLLQWIALSGVTEGNVS